MVENPGGTAVEVFDGAAIYRGGTLNRYDKVLYVNSRFFWGCHKREITSNYQAVVRDSSRHLEIGVGTGYCPANSQFAVPDPEITLVDLNPQTLEFAARRLAPLRTRRIQANALEPLTEAGVPERSFDSVAVNLLLHCIPGDISAKEAVLANAVTAARPGGRIVGATVLAKGVHVSLAGRWLMRRKNAKGIFHNLDDSLADLDAALRRHCAEYHLKVRGAMALFSGTAR